MGYTVQQSLPSARRSPTHVFPLYGTVKTPVPGTSTPVSIRESKGNMRFIYYQKASKCKVAPTQAILSAAESQAGVTYACSKLASSIHLCCNLSMPATTFIAHSLLILMVVNVTEYLRGLLGPLAPAVQCICPGQQLY